MPFKYLLTPESEPPDDAVSHQPATWAKLEPVLDVCAITRKCLVAGHSYPVDIGTNFWVLHDGLIYDGDRALTKAAFLSVMYGPEGPTVEHRPDDADPGLQVAEGRVWLRREMAEGHLGQDDAEQAAKEPVPDGPSKFHEGGLVSDGPEHVVPRADGERVSGPKPSWHDGTPELSDYPGLTPEIRLALINDGLFTLGAVARSRRDVIEELFPAECRKEVVVLIGAALDAAGLKWSEVEEDLLAIPDFLRRKPEPKRLGDVLDLPGDHENPAADAPEALDPSEGAPEAETPADDAPAPEDEAPKTTAEDIL